MSLTTSATEKKAPTVVGIRRQSPATETTNASSVTFRVTFSEKVSGVDASDFIALALSGNVRGTLADLALETLGVKGSSAVVPVGDDRTTYDVSVRALSGSGTLRLDLKADSRIRDSDGNIVSGGYAAGETYTIKPSGGGFAAFSDIAPLPIASHTGQKPQAKLWTHAGAWWTVLSTGDGTNIFRLDGAQWTPVLQVATSTNAKADCRVAGEVVHLLLYRGGGKNSYLVSVEYDANAQNYKPWSQRPGRSTIVFHDDSETATLVLEEGGRLWVASDGNDEMELRWSDAPYTDFSSPITVAAGMMDDDICALAALPGKIGLLWSDQNTKRFGFRTHANGDDPRDWSPDEAPGAATAQDVGKGFGDDHLNIMTASDGTLYCAVKTSYDKSRMIKLCLLVRRPDGSWDDPYPVTTAEGTRPFVLLNEAAGKLRVVYSSLENGGDILYRESSLAPVSFGPPFTLISGNSLYNYATGTHQVCNGDVVVLATNVESDPLLAVAVRATDS
ncbi:hypothetical protein V9K67_04190 [Paraflavisolibacter sp. H34]|uniref:hypothetical protein n=1 Tax=Huijunlia imazamoxiresistens TaxID=3127457 RepID=UPI00301A7E11